MPALASALRKTLDSTVVKARDLAERGAREALTGLAVEAKSFFPSMDEGEQALRNRLRARGRQLGDQRDAHKGTQSIERLVREMAYEHWHRMLFARFLAENQLLIEPSSGVAVSLAECEELAAEAGTDLWELAASYAQGMLPEIFRTDDPLLALRLPLEIRQQLQALVAGLESEVFTASDSLGWTYQFWQTKRKKEVNDSGVKIGADELSPVTQLFTEDYMVDFLLDNTLGAWHAGKVLAANPQLASTAQTEDDLRQAVALPGCPWTYLRFIQAEDGPWAPASGSFEGWPNTAAALKCLDPCMGSGHFVVAMFERLVALRIEEEGLTDKAAVAAVIEDNLFGLEIDPRCTQIGAFNLALAAWRRVGHCKLPAMNLACSGLAPNSREADWLAIAGDNQKLQRGMERLYRLFQKAAVLGSLINPRAGEGDLLVAAFHELQPLLDQALAQESQDDTAHEMAVTARGLANAAEILAGQFTLVGTNVPYLGAGDQGEEMRTLLGERYPVSRSDLATCFVERCLAYCSPAGSVSLVTPENWLFLSSYKRLRKQLLAEAEWRFAVRLGEKSFESSQAAGAFAAMAIISAAEPKPGTKMCCIDVASAKIPSEKDDAVRHSDVRCKFQSEQIANPDSRVVLEDYVKAAYLSEHAETYKGICCGDSSRFQRGFWELPRIVKNRPWTFQQSSIDAPSDFTGREGLFLWENGRGEFLRCTEERLGEGKTSAWIRGEPAWGRTGLVVKIMRQLPVTRYTGEIFDNNVAVIVPRRADYLPAIWEFCSSSEFCKEVRKLNPKISVTDESFVQVPFDLAHWQKVAAEKYPDGLPKPFSSDPTQWLFNGHPAGADQPLHVAVARLLGYQWPRQTGSSFPDCPALGPDGLESLADDDGIVCLSPARGEAAAADRLRRLLAAAFGDEWSNSKERELLLETAVANGAKKAPANLGDWLRQNFFAEHCKLFQSRPFIWQIWDGNAHGFSALVNYHKLAAPNGQGRKTLDKLTFTYLRDWIDRQKQDQAEGVNGADDRYAAALDLQGQLQKILEGEPPFDIFVRWKPLHQQAIDWAPDIDDGVRLNIRPFLNATLRQGGRKGAGILRWKPLDIKRKADRGNEPMRSKEEFPWFWGWDAANQSHAVDFGAPLDTKTTARYQPAPAGSFDGNRWNDLHYSRAAKEVARAKQRGEA